MLVANILTRRIRNRWVQQTEHYLRTQNAGDRPQPLMITIEEAHKFLNPATARQTIFGTIARELRKYSVTLLVVDQRPSSIDSEVMSQLGSRITALLNDDKDIDAVFTGVSGSSSLKAVLASLDTRQQAMVLGHAVPMPVVVRTRPYDAAFYKAMGAQERTIEARRKTRAETEELFPEKF
jgi:DNA helicase HerA-like ATPase